MSILTSTHAGAKPILFKRNLRTFAMYALYVYPYTKTNALRPKITPSMPVWSTIDFYSQKSGEFYYCHLYTYCTTWKIKEFEQNFINFVKNGPKYDEYPYTIDDVVFPSKYIDQEQYKEKEITYYT